MPSYDLKVSIERYPETDDDIDLGHSWGCPELNLMGYEHLESLLFDIHTKLIGREMGDLE
jgi:hypothetical protein